jgi:glycosyltransferase involved in cell wall biosynthesis
MTRILFFTPFGGRTGSEMMLWNLLQRMDSGQFQAALYAEKVGSLKAALPAHIPFHTSPFNESPARRLVSKLTTAAGYSAWEGRIMAIHRQLKPDFWYLNTSAVAYVAHLAIRHGIRFVAHLSEMPYLLYESVKAPDLKAMLQAELVIGVSDVCCQSARVMGATNVQLLHPSVDLSQIRPSPARVAALRQQLGIPADAWVWAMSGSLIYRKGIDYLPQIIRQMQDRGRRCFFLWLGGGANNGAEHYLRCELQHAGFDNVLLTGALTADYYDHMALADGFMLLSHEETFGMVNVEAAYLGKPIVCFDCGGVRDIMRPGMGQIVESWNIADFADAMEAQMDGHVPFDAVVARTRALDFTPETQYTKWEEIMKELMSR